MDEKLDQLFFCLDDVLSQKCYELKKNRRNRLLQRCFAVACLVLLTVPIPMIFWGVNIVTICIPFSVFLSVGLLVITPMILLPKSGGNCNENI